jgi:hypothetical protein
MDLTSHPTSSGNEGLSRFGDGEAAGGGKKAEEKHRDSGVVAPVVAAATAATAASMRGNDLLFVTGVFRSGTSLLYTSLNQHPEIGLMYEAELQSHDLAERHFRHRQWLENANAWGKFLGRHGFPPFPSGMQTQIRKPEDLYRAFAGRKGARYAGEKSPALVNFLPEVHARFPGARLITLSRHPMAVYASVRRASLTDPWFARRGMLARLLAGQETMLEDARALQRRGVPMLHLTYEELTADPERECRRLCEFLGLEFDPRMTSLKEANLDAVYEGAHHRKLHGASIAATPLTDPGLSLEWRETLEAYWARTQSILAAWREGRFEEELPPIEQPLLRAAVRHGRWRHRLTRWKRRLYHRAPSELVRALRAIKVLHRESSITAEDPRSSRQTALIGAGLTAVTLVSYVVGVFLCFHGKATLSPLPFFILPPLLAGWFLGGKAMVVHACLAALVWSLVPKLSFASDQPLGWIAWNAASRALALCIIGFFAWHLKATLLQHQKTQRF